MACSPQFDNRGHVIQKESIKKIEVGQYKREQVLTLLGSPSATGTFEDNSWYYISQKIASKGFLDPELINQSITMIEFDDNGYVKSIRNIEEEEIKEIELVEKVTPTKGKKLGLFEQILGNLGVPVSGQ
tara:strand:+ start:17316 stop:17702 length:387 start_codon:yes stop_codon:yes gene_type:complete